jgi:hypothetical protein
MAGRVPLVRVQLGKRSFVGIIQSVKIRYRTDGEIGYTIKFSPHTNENVGDFRRVPATAPQAHPTDSRLSELDDLLSGQYDANTIAVAEVPAKTEDVETFVQTLDSVSVELRRADAAWDAIAFDALLVEDATTLAEQTLGRLLALATSFDRTADAADAMAFDISQLAAVDVVAYDDVVGGLAFEEWSRNAHRDATLMAASSRAAARDARARAAQHPLTIHVVRQGETLMRLSTRYYGTPNSWRLIYNANDLDSIALVVGTSLIIPERQR